MLQGAVTLAHSHDDDDELLSAVYYVDVPAHSGNLIIYNQSGNTATEKIEISPVTGEFIFFDADVRHEVTINCSNKARLSIAFNFGPAKN